MDSNGRDDHPRQDSARIDIMSGADRTKRKPHAGKDVLRFAPNFTVYSLQPDAVCLYSEDRKFFLHGALYHALALALGQGGKRERDLVRSLAPHFPPDKIDEALKRLLEGGYVLRGPRASAGAVGGYWASLGLSPQTAADNLRKCRVGI